MDKSACIDPYVRCAFYGACQTAFGFENACIIAHSPQGCQLSADVAFRWQQADYTLTEVLCSKLCEDEIVHGGEDTLKRTILDAVNYKVPLVMVVSACGPEIVGDNIAAVAEEMESEVDFQIVPIAAPGFLGSQYKGVDIALKALLTTFDKKEEKEDTVCVVAPHASQNPTWPGDLSWMKTVFNTLKVEVTSVLTHRSSLTDVYNALSSETCMVLSHDAGMGSLCDTEQLCNSIPLPVGLENTRQFLTQLGTRFDAEKTVEDIIERGEKTVIQHLRRRGLHIEFFNKVSTAVVADNTIGIPLLRFLVEDLEMIPELVLLRSDTQKVLAEKEMTNLQISPVFACGVDVYQVKEYLKNVSPTCVVGSNIERHLAKELGIPLSFEIIHPVLEYKMTDRQYFGYTGMLHLIEIIQNEWWNKWKSKKKRYKSKW